MPNLRTKTWTTTTPATVDDAQFWEDHLIADATLNDLETKKHTHGNKDVLDELSEDSDGDLNFRNQKIKGGGDAYSHIKVGTVTMDATDDDTVEFVAGSNVTLTPDSTNKTVTISTSGGGGGTGGDMYKSEFVLAGGTGQVLSAKEADHATGADAVGTADTDVLEGLSDNAGNLMYNGRAVGGGQGGSVVYVSTTSFIGYSVSISITDTITGITETATTTFNSSGKASFNLVSIGTATITVTDGTTAFTSTCAITCYSEYEAPPINRFNANIVVTAKCGSNFVMGAEVIVDGVPSGKYTNASGVATVSVGALGTYTIEIQKDGAKSANKSTVSITSETSRSCIVNIARIKYTFTGDLVATITGGTFTKNVTSSTSPVYVYVPSLQTYTLIGTLDTEDVEASTAVTSYDEFETSVIPFSATINVGTPTGAVVTATSGANVFTATSVSGVASVTVKKAGAYTITSTIGGVTSDDTTTVTVSNNGEVKSATVNFATIKMLFDGTLIANVSKNSFSAAVNTSTSPYTIFVPSLGTYSIVGTLSGENIENEVDVENYSEFECEIVSTITINVDVYSAVSDTVYFYKNNDTSDDPIILCTTDSSGKAENVSLTVKPDQSISFYSTVAKDEESGTSAYSKSITITDSTNEIKVMPNGAIYWYGAFPTSNTLSAYAYGRSGYSATTKPILTQNTNYTYATIASSNYATGSVFFDELIDLSGYNSIRLDSYGTGKKSTPILMLSNTKGASFTPIKQLSLGGNSDSNTETSMDIHLSDDGMDISEYSDSKYIFFNLQMWSTTANGSIPPTIRINAVVLE